MSKAHKKHKIRELAMQVVFVWDAHGSADSPTADQVMADGTDDPEVRRAALQMARGTWETRGFSDAWIERLAPQWPPRRQPGIDRNLLRLAVWELTHAETPPKVVLDEAIELARQFSTEQSAAFINGVLDSVLREHLERIASHPSPTDGHSPPTTAPVESPLPTHEK